jgi:glycosyltransferase involved in cell wall biosynthesis
VRICLVTEHEYGSGAGIAAYRLAVALADSGHDVFYMYFLPYPGFQNSLTNKVNVGGNSSSFLRKIYLSLSSMSVIGGWYEFNKNFRSLFNLVKDIKPDIINLHNVGKVINHKAVSVLATHYPVVWTLHDLFGIRGYSYKFNNRNGQTIKTAPISFRRVDRLNANRLIDSDNRICFVSPSKWLSHLIYPNLKGRKTIQVIPNGISKFDFYPENKCESRKKLKLSESALMVLSVASRLSYERKNIQVLIDAVNLLEKQSIKLLLVGEADNEMLRKYPMIKHFGAILEISKLRELYSASDIFVVPSLIDNLPNTMIESLYCGTPVIGADVGGIPEAVVPNITGWLFNPFKPKELSNILRTILEDRSFIEDMSENCINFATSRFSREHQTNSYLTLFKTILS